MRFEQRYDDNGCPRKFEFSEKNRLTLFDKNLRKSIKFSKRPLTARSKGTKCRSSNSKIASMNNSSTKDKRRSVFDDMEGIQGHKRMKLIPTSCKSNSSKNNLATTPSYKCNDKVKDLLKCNRNQNWNDLKRFDFIWKEQPEYLSSYDNLTSKQTETSSRNFNIFSTK